jgi:hypothetical protein
MLFDVWLWALCLQLSLAACPATLNALGEDVSYRQGLHAGRVFLIAED